MPRQYNRKPSTDAIHNPVMSGPKETQFDASAIPQRPAINLDHVAEHGAPAIEIVDRLPDQDYAEALKFNEDPLEVVITPSSDRNAAKQIRCSVNGRGAEVWDENNKRWIEFTWLPVGRRLTVKRKYMEVLARSRTDTFRTQEVSPTPLPNQDGFVLRPETVAIAPFNVLHDPAGAKGHEWYQRVIAEY